MPDLVFKGAAAEVRFFGSPTLADVLNPFQAVPLGWWLLAGKGASEAVTVDQVPGNVPKLGGKVLVNEQYMHRNRSTLKHEF